MKVLVYFCVLSCTLLRAQSAPEPADALLGTWLTKEGDRIEVYRCGDYYCGKIADISEKIYKADDRMAGKAKIDRENPDPAHRNDAIIGLQIMQQFTYDPERHLWQGGTIYDPNNGKTYKCKIESKDGALRVRGYIGIPALGRTEIWKRP